MAHKETMLSRRLTQGERKRALATLEAARHLRDEMLAERGGKPFSDSSELIEQMREERSLHPQ